MKKSLSRKWLFVLAVLMFCMLGNRKNVPATTMLKANKTAEGKLTEKQPAQKYKVTVDQVGILGLH